MQPWQWAVAALSIFLIPAVLLVLLVAIGAVRQDRDRRQAIADLSASDWFRAMAYEVAGVTSRPFMIRHPDDEMPIDEISEAVEAVLADYGVKPVGL